MSKHTSGPWEVMDSFYPSIKEVVGPSFNVKAVMWATDLTEKDYQERSADLRLIAAAPDLLEALESAWLWMENQADGQSKGGHATFDLMMLREQRDLARAAIAKATGKQP